MSNDAPIHECESEIDHYTGHYVPYSLRRVCGFFNVPQIYYMCKGLWDGAYGLSSLSEKTRKSNRLQMLLQTKAALSPQLFKDPECWSGRGLNLRHPAQQTGAYPIELTGRRLSWLSWLSRLSWPDFKHWQTPCCSDANCQKKKARVKIISLELRKWCSVTDEE